MGKVIFKKCSSPYLSQDGGDANNFKSEARLFVFNMKNTPFQWGFLDVGFFNGQGFAPGENGVVYQRFIEWNTGRLAFRTFQNNTWSAWVKIDNSYLSVNGGDANNFKSESHLFVFNMKNTPFQWGFLDVAFFDGNSFAPAANGVVFQRFIEWNTGRIAFRTFQNNTWSAWNIAPMTSQANISFLNGWQIAFDDNLARISRVGNMVTLNVSAKNTQQRTSGDVILQLPVGFRPAANISVLVISTVPNIYRVIIDSLGQISLRSTVPANVGIAINVSFSAPS